MNERIPILIIKELQLQIAKNARLSRLINGYTQSELSRSSGVSYATIRKFERTGEISFQSLLKIADRLDGTKVLQSLFPKADHYQYLNPHVFKRPKLHANGTYHSSRIPSPDELERFLELEDSPDSLPAPKSRKRKRDWKNIPKTDDTWDPNEELKRYTE